MELWNYKGCKNTITEALQLSVPEHAVICLTGAGGKTSLLIAWAREFAATGKRTVVTTTTHMFDPAFAGQGETSPYGEIRLIYTGAANENNLTSAIDRILDEDGIVIVASQDTAKPGKLMSPPTQILDHIFRTADVVLIEADGSRRMPLKWPAPREPVIPDNTDITVCVAGLSGLGKNPAEVMYRADHLPESLRRDIVDETLLSTVLASYEGGQKDIRGEFRVFLNQADTEELRLAATRMQLLLGVRGIQSAWGTMKP